MKVAIYPLGTSDSRTLVMGKVVTATNLRWFPDGKRLAVLGSEEGKAPRTYIVNLSSGAAEAVGPESSRWSRCRATASSLWERQLAQTRRQWTIRGREQRGLS